MPTVLTLNIARPPASRASALLEWLWHRPEDVLVLTETARGGGSALVESVCRAAGHGVHASLTLPDRPLPDRRATRGALGVTIVVRGGLGSRRIDVGVPEGFPERVVAVEVGEGSAYGMDGCVGEPTLRVVGVYGLASDPVRYASAAQRQRKRAWLLAFCSWVATLPPVPTVLVGDLNIVAPGHASVLPYVLAEERTAYDLLVACGWTDAYADTHREGVLAGAPTWVDHSGAACRYDYVLLGPGVRGGRADIEAVPAGLTDHSVLTWRPEAAYGPRFCGGGGAD